MPDTNVWEENWQYDTLLEKTECGEESGDSAMMEAFDQWKPAYTEEEETWEHKYLKDCHVEGELVFSHVVPENRPKIVLQKYRILVNKLWHWIIT